ncbi:MAG: hypothetical protein IH939_17415 [Acidobacteria bacterium]|nr:hypothetical protein [Acidobacteriota bacterium]
MHVLVTGRFAFLDGTATGADRPHQLIDIYLLGLACAQRGCVATFDRSIPLTAVIGAMPQTLAVIEPAG